MATQIFRIEGPRLTGKTTIGVGFIREQRRQGIRALYVAATQNFARDQARRFGLPMDWVFGGDWISREPSSVPGAMVIDDLEKTAYTEQQIAYIAKRMTAVYSSPTQIILIRNLD